MYKFVLAITALGAVLTYGCASPKETQLLKPTHSAQVNASDAVKSLVAPAPENMLAKTLVAFGKLKSFRVRETFDPVAGTHAIYEVEVLVPDKEHVISHGDCANNQRGETITIGNVHYSRCGLTEWTQTKQAGNGTHATYTDYLENTHTFALTSLETRNLWQILADYPGGNSPLGTMTWLISQKDFLPRKLTFIAEGGYTLASEFRDFDDPSIVIIPPAPN